MAHNGEKLPVDPLRRAIARWISEGLRTGETWRTEIELAAWAGISVKTIVRIYRRAQATVDVRTADRLCRAMHTHPALVWPDWIERGLAREEARRGA